MPTVVKYDLPLLQSQQTAAAKIDFDGDTIKVMLVTSVYTPAAATHDFIDDASANEVSGTGYTAGGAAIANSAVSAAGLWTHDDVVWSQNAGGFANARTAIWYKDTGTPATSPLICYLPFGTDKGNVDGDLTLDTSPGVLDWD